MSSEAPEGTYVIDSGALIVYLLGSGGAEMVERVFRQCKDCAETVTISAYDLLAVYWLIAQKAPKILEELASLTDQLPLLVEPLNGGDALEAADLIRAFRDIPESEAVAVTLAQRKHAVLITKDRVAAKHTRSLYIGPNGS